MKAADEDEPVTRRVESHRRGMLRRGEPATVESPSVPGQPLRLLGVADARSINVARWARRLVERGHEVHLVSDRLPPSDAPVEGVAVHDVRDARAR